MTRITDFETEKQRLLRKKDALILGKREHETTLVAIKNAVRSGGRLPNEKYRQYCDAQYVHSRAVYNIEKQLAPIKMRLREIADSEFKERCGSENAAARDEAPKSKAIVDELVALRQEYRSFVADETRASPMRQMAAEFAARLDSILAGERREREPGRP